VSTRNLVDPVAVHFLRTELRLEAFAYHAGKEAAHRVLLPARGLSRLLKLPLCEGTHDTRLYQWALIVLANVVAPVIDD
jgi:hypothetical protein